MPKWNINFGSCTGAILCSVLLAHHRVFYFPGIGHTEAKVVQRPPCTKRDLCHSRVVPVEEDEVNTVLVNTATNISIKWGVSEIRSF